MGYIKARASLVSLFEGSLRDVNSRSFQACSSRYKNRVVSLLKRRWVKGEIATT